jgi:hypothetical protein
MASQRGLQEDFHLVLQFREGHHAHEQNDQSFGANWMFSGSAVHRGCEFENAGRLPYGDSIVTW